MTDGETPTNFIRQIIDSDLGSRNNDGRVVTRFSSGAQRLSAHRPRQGHLPQLRHRRGLRRALHAGASTTRIRSKRASSTWSPSRKTFAGWAMTGARICVTLPSTSPSSMTGRWRWCGKARPTWTARALTRSVLTGARSPKPGATGPCRHRSVDENLDLLARMRGGRVRRWQSRTAREDRYGIAEHESA